MDFEKLKSNIPNLINLAKRIEIISLNIKNQYWDDNQITNKKYILLKYIEELELLQNIWEFFSFNSIINNSDIKCPYILAHNIRNILDTPLTKDENNEDFVWLTDKEKSLIKLFQSINFNKKNKEDTDEDENIEKQNHLHKDTDILESEKVLNDDGKEKCI
jgi:hypothetical protein